MSLIERALEKARLAGEERPALSVKRPAVGWAEPKAPAEPTFSIEFPDTRLRAAGYLAPADQMSRITAQYQSVKRQLLTTARSSVRDAQERHNTLIMVTSAVAGEGKTFNSIHLALCLAQDRDIEVLLVDADFAKRTVSKLFGLEERTGFIDACRDERLSVTDLIVGTSVRGLRVLPAGRSQDGTTECLASEHTKHLLDQLAADPRRLVVLDAAPLLLTAESSALAQWIGQLLLVVRAGVSPRAAVQHALSSLDRQEGVALVFNGETNNALQDYLYGYNNSYAYAPPADPNQPKS
jgi:protein-tyrosine kinase